MRLLNFKTMTLDFVPDAENAPGYSILSHTWSIDKDRPEVVFENLLANPEIRDELLRAMEAAPGEEIFAERRAKFGKKLVGFSRKSIDMGLEYGWIDTLCIDKRVSRKIGTSNTPSLADRNSRRRNCPKPLTQCGRTIFGPLFVWHTYPTSTICRKPTKSRSRTLCGSLEVWLMPKSISKIPSGSLISRCVGWTLQELLAPQDVIFFTAGWNYIGSRETLAEMLHEITTIPTAICADGYRSKSSRDVIKGSIGERFAWAATRKTTRREDRAYSLMV